ncbi:MAG: organic solvent tolerance protein OstA [Pirellulaceae bacterium]
MQTSLDAQEIAYEPPAVSHPIKLSAKRSGTWKQGSYDVIYLGGDVSILQGEMQATANEAVVLIEKSEAVLDLDSPTPQPPKYKAIIFAEGLVEVTLPATSAGDQSANRIVDSSWLGRMYTDIQVEIPVDAKAIDPANPPELFARAEAAIVEGPSNTVQLAQFQEPGNPPVAVPQVPQSTAPQRVINPLTGEIQTIDPPAPDAIESFRPNAEPTPQAEPAGQATRGIPRTRGSIVDITARDSTVDFNMRIETNKANPNERIYIGTGGVRVSIDDPELASSAALRDDGGRSVVVLADNIVAWQTTQYDGSATWELYLEGNVVFSKGTRTIFSDQMYFDASRFRGTILNADMLTPVARYNGLVRLKAKVIEQVDQNTLQAHGAAFTTSRMGVPRYWLQSDSIQVTRQPSSAVNAAGVPMFDPQTGQLEGEEEYIAESRNNFLYMSDRPVFYWPRSRINLSDPAVYLEQIRFGNDNIFGFQAHTAWNMFQLLGIRNRPENTRWLGIVDYMSERGLGLGSELDYARQSLFGLPGRAEGYYRSWFIRDKGLDQLGRDRFNLVPEEEMRGNMLLRHRNRFEPGYSLRAEVGYLSDRNFLEQFYERRWDMEKDYTTGAWLERNVGTQSFNLLTNYQFNEFFTQTSWLPRADHFVIGQPLLNDRIVWHAHSHIGYGRFRSATAPLDPTDLAPFDYLAWEAPKATGVRMGTRHELDAPFQLGPVKVVPYLLGDLSYWQQDLTQSDLVRGYGQIGLRSSLPFWKVDPTVQSTLWNVRGLAHKVTLESEVFFADASQNMDELPLYDPLDDDAQEHFRHRLAFNTFGILPGGNVPLQFDERYFALRSGMQNWVAAPSAEIADDLAIVRFGANQRWQTKRGMPGQERIIDWITFNTHVTLFPMADRDNFGQDWGVFNYNFRWYLGDRLSLVSDGYADFFSQGLRTASVGFHLGRPENGSLYLGFRSIEGPISSNIINASVDYRMSDKWGVRANTSVDFGETGTIGNAVNLIYIGESFLWRVGANADLSRDNVGIQFGVEPRFLNRPRIFRPGNVAIGPAGSRWLE